MAEWHSIVFLDRKCILTGSYAAGTGNTTWTLPITDDTLDTIVLGPAFGNAAGDILAVDSNSGGTVTKAGDYSAGEVCIGRAFTMSIELTRPYVRDRQGNPDVDAWTSIRRIEAIFNNAGALTIRTSMPRRTDRRVDLDRDPMDVRGHLTAWHNGHAEDMRVFFENYSPKPSTVSSAKFVVDYEPRRGG